MAGRSLATERSSYRADQNVAFTGPRAFVGITDGSVAVGTPQYRDCSFGRMAAAHIGYFRAVLSLGRSGGDAPPLRLRLLG